MGYWMHVYSQTDEVMEVETIREFFEDDDVTVEVFGDQTGAGWKQITLSHTGDDDQALAIIEAHTGDEVPERIAVEIENLAEAEPACNAEWVVEFLRGVKTIYAFEIGSGVDVDDGWEYVRGLMREMCEGYDGILYAELEGYSNETGYHVTWEFSDDAPGVWWMALYDAKTGEWRSFQMELSNLEHRAAFRAGRVPDGVKVR
jgi:hypothetical protein